MQVVLETDEAWSLMTLVASYIIDHSGVSGDGKGDIRRWRSRRALGTVEMDELAIAMNEALGNIIDEKTVRLIRRKGRYISTRQMKEAAG